MHAAMKDNDEGNVRSKHQRRGCSGGSSQSTAYISEAPHVRQIQSDQSIHLLKATTITSERGLLQSATVGTVEI